MTKLNTWFNKQPRTNKMTFEPKWDPETILWIISQLNLMVDFIDIQYTLVKKHGIKLITAERWIRMSQNVMKDMNNGLTFDDAIERDKERRNMIRRKKTAQPLGETAR